MKKILIVFAAILLSAPLSGQDNKFFRIGVDTSVDGFLSSDNRIGAASFGVGARVRLGRYDQWLNLVGGVRYIYGTRLSGFQVPILVNVNLLKGSRFSGYLGGGYGLVQVPGEARSMMQAAMREVVAVANAEGGNN